MGQKTDVGLGRNVELQINPAHFRDAAHRELRGSGDNFDVPLIHPAPIGAGRHDVDEVFAPDLHFGRPGSIFNLNGASQAGLETALKDLELPGRRALGAHRQTTQPRTCQQG